MSRPPSSSDVERIRPITADSSRPLSRSGLRRTPSAFSKVLQDDDAPSLSSSPRLGATLRKTSSIKSLRTAAMGVAKADLDIPRPSSARGSRPNTGGSQRSFGRNTPSPILIAKGRPEITVDRSLISPVSPNRPSNLSIPLHIASALTDEDEQDSMDAVMTKMLTEIEKVQQDSERHFIAHERLLERLGYTTDEASEKRASGAEEGTDVKRMKDKKKTGLKTLEKGQDRPSTPNRMTVMSHEEVEALTTRRTRMNKSPLPASYQDGKSTKTDSLKIPPRPVRKSSVGEAGASNSKRPTHRRNLTAESIPSITDGASKATATASLKKSLSKTNLADASPLSVPRRRKSSISEEAIPAAVSKLAATSSPRKFSGSSLQVPIPSSRMTPSRRSVSSNGIHGVATSEDEAAKPSYTASRLMKTPSKKSGTLSADPSPLLAQKNVTSSSTRTRVKPSGSSLMVPSPSVPQRKLSAGSTRSVSDLATLREELDRYKRTVEDLQEQLQSAQQASEDAIQMLGKERGARERLEREARAAMSRAEEAEQAHQEALIELQSARSDLEVMEARSQDTAVRLEEARMRASDYEDEAEKLRDQLEQLRGEMRAVKANERYWETTLEREKTRFNARIAELEKSVMMLSSTETTNGAHVGPTSVDESATLVREADTFRPATELERLRDLITELSREKENLQVQLDQSRLSGSDRGSSSELTFYKEQFAKLAAENDELKKSRDRLEAQILSHRPDQDLKTSPPTDNAGIYTHDGVAGLRARSSTTRTYASLHLHGDNSVSSTWSKYHHPYDSPAKLRAVDERIPNLMQAVMPLPNNMEESPVDPNSARPFRTPSPSRNYRTLPGQSPSAVEMSLGARHISASPLHVSRTASAGDGNCEIGQNPLASTSSPSLSRTLTRKRSTTNEADGNFGEKWTRELQRLQAERELLEINFASIPVTGGGVQMRRLKEDLEDRIDEIDRDLASTKRKLKSIGLL